MSKGIVSRILRRIGVIVGTALAIAMAVGAVMFGSDALAKRVENTPPPTPATLTAVAVSSVQFEDHYTTTRRFLGQVEATADAALSFELGGRLAELTVNEGESVTKGAVIARLDTALLEAERQRLAASKDATRAQLTFAETRLTRAEQLLDEGFSSQETLDQARATRDELVSRIAEIDAGLTSVTINVEKSELRAPFDGRVGALDVEVSETVSPGQMIVSLIEIGDPIVRVGLPLSLMEADLQGVKIETAGQQHQARLLQLRPDIDPTTRTRTALFALDTQAMLTFGQTATLLVNVTVPVQGAWVTLDALQQGSGSIWTVLVVEDNIVRTAAVEVLFQQSDRAFVQGSFAEGTKLIRTGAHRVVPGQQVQILGDEA
ncbi:efflux RND transporter periplasmic adaptor subunit [Yoonia sp. GPGPB17]|uniref:efflux RND transporter periplasmic adaptor subunit n=1 Tax=Yoonia sp. GPGPB17 TaxID=3026147 RepID=UPI0030BD9CFF